jgi:hypothetical protein
MHHFIYVDGSSAMGVVLHNHRCESILGMARPLEHVLSTTIVEALALARGLGFLN